MRCIFADPNPVFLHWLRRYFRSTPVALTFYPLIVPAHPEVAWAALPRSSVAWLVVPGENESQLRLEQGVEGARCRLHCPAASAHNTRQLVRAVLKYVRLHGEQVEFVVFPCLAATASSLAAQDTHAGYVDATMKKCES